MLHTRLQYSLVWNRGDKSVNKSMKIKNEYNKRINTIFITTSGIQCNFSKE